MIWNGMVWYGESDRLSSHWWGECIRQVLLLNHLVYHPVNQHRCGKSTIRKSCPEETTMKFHSIPELYVRLRIPFDTQTWLKKIREFYVFLRCPWSTHVMSTRWPSWNPLRKQRHRCAVVLFFVRSWMGQKCEHFFEGLRVVVEFGQTWCITRNGHIIIWILDTTVPRNGQFSDPWGGGCGSRRTGINLSTSTSSILSALADAATCCHLTQTVPCCHLTKPASCWLQLRAAGGASTWRCLPPLQRMEWAI